MNLNSQAENARTLAAAIGIGETEAAELLRINVLVTYEETDPASVQLATNFSRLLSRTIQSVSLNSENFSSPAVEVVIGKAKPQLRIPKIFVTWGADSIWVGPGFKEPNKGRTHPVTLTLAACYTVAAVLKKVLGSRLPFTSPEFFEVDLGTLLGTDAWRLYEPFDFGEAYLAGAGAVGNAFVFGLTHFQATGSLNIADDDKVSDGNLQRCLLFEKTDIGLSKTMCLSNAARRLLPNVEMISHECRLQEAPGRFDGPWLKRLIVGVDSPRARRSLQSEVPREVFDASTTGISEVVFHFNHQPSSMACMSCVYHETPEELSHERHVAEVLGVSVSSVRQVKISHLDALTICQNYSSLLPEDITGIAYDTLFKQICSAGHLTTPEDRQVLAPFAFISTLAGTIQAMEFVRRIQRGHEGIFNEWRISPWANPVMRRRRRLNVNPDCEICGNPVIAELAQNMWQQEPLDRKALIKPLMTHLHEV